MFKIQNNCGMVLSFSVYVIEISVIRICFVLRYSKFGFQCCFKTDEIQYYFKLPFFTAQFMKRGPRTSEPSNG
jgi:hypothetical protein